MRTTADPMAVKLESEAIVRTAGGRVCDWLPYLDRAELRSHDQIVGRALVMNGLLNIHFQAPVSIVAEWIDKHRLSAHLSSNERKLLGLRNEELSEQQLINLYWYIEALWAFMWVGQLIDDLPFQSHVEDRMASMCPNLERGEGPAKFADVMIVRGADEVFRMLDLYYRVHWWARDGRLNGYSTEPVSLDIVMERRKALEWALNPACDWDDVPLDT